MSKSPMATNVLGLRRQNNHQSRTSVGQTFGGTAARVSVLAKSGCAKQVPAAYSGTADEQTQNRKRESNRSHGYHHRGSAPCFMGRDTLAHDGYEIAIEFGVNIPPSQGTIGDSPCEPPSRHRVKSLILVSRSLTTPISGDELAPNDVNPPPNPTRRRGRSSLPHLGTLGNMKTPGSVRSASSGLPRTRSVNDPLGIQQVPSVWPLYIKDT
jgi:hypothetical protein